MPKIFDVKQWPRVLWQNPLLFLTVLLLGAATAFVYSYAPLHRAKDWKIGYLEERLEIRTAQAEELEQELEQARAALDGTPSGEELGAVRAQLDEATSLAAANDKQMADLKSRLASAEQSRNKWKSRYDKLVPELEAARRASEAQAVAATSDPPLEEAPAVASEEAAPARPAAPAAQADDDEDL